jgi:AcrR family transcriptional regulator
MPSAAKEPGTRLTPEQIVERLVDAATRLLADKGPSEIKVRSVAQAAGVSPTAVYYHLGGLPELLQAVADQGFRDLGRAFEAVAPGDDPVADLFSLAMLNRQLAQRNPHLYDLMFGLSTRGSYRPPGSPRPGAGGRSDALQSVYNHMLHASSRLVDSGRVRTDEDPEIIGLQLWSCVHGFITLELGGHFTQFPDPVRHILTPATVKILVGLGDSPERAYASHASVLEFPAFAQ